MIPPTPQLGDSDNNLLFKICQSLTDGGLVVTQAYVDSQDNLRVLKAGDTMTGSLLMQDTSVGWNTGASAADTFLVRDAAGILADRNGASAQTMRWYETFTNASNYSRLTHTTQAGNHLIRTEASGTGTLRILQVGTGPAEGANVVGKDFVIHGGQGTGSAAGGSVVIQLAVAGGAGSGVNTLANFWEFSASAGGTFRPTTDNVYDIGSSTFRIRDLNAGRAIVAGQSITCGASFGFVVSGSSQVRASTDGILVLFNNAATEEG